MEGRAVLAASAGFFLLAVGALTATVVMIRVDRAPPAPPPAPASVAPAPGPPVAPPVAAPPAPTPAPAAPAPAPQATPSPAPTPSATPVSTATPGATPPASHPEPRPMRTELGMSISDTPVTNVIEFGSSSASALDHTPKVSGLSGGSPAAQAGIKLGEHIYAVDGKSISSASDFEACFRDRKAPGEVTIRVGATPAEAHDVKVVFK
ncbi:hypothetical protein HY251_17020 [bacterium]|nr:hypothetical protein [bacterium]